MLKNFSEQIIRIVGKFLSKEYPQEGSFLSDINQIAELIRPADILLIEGHSRVSKVIKANYPKPMVACSFIFRSS